MLSEIPIGPMTNEADWKELFETLLWLQVSSQVEGALVIFCILLYQDKSMNLVLGCKNIEKMNQDFSATVEMTEID